eukprot:COSAG02_NODE_4663_length_5118_cov_1.862921_4_plen_270_part_00
MLCSDAASATILTLLRNVYTFYNQPSSRAACQTNSTSSADSETADEAFRADSHEQQSAPTCLRPSPSEHRSCVHVASLHEVSLLSSFVGSSSLPLLSSLVGSSLLPPLPQWLIPVPVPRYKPNRTLSLMTATPTPKAPIGRISACTYLTQGSAVQVSLTGRDFARLTRAAAVGAANFCPTRANTCIGFHQVCASVVGNLVVRKGWVQISARRSFSCAQITRAAARAGSTRFAGDVRLLGAHIAGWRVVAHQNRDIVAAEIQPGSCIGAT